MLAFAKAKNNDNQASPIIHIRPINYFFKISSTILLIGKAKCFLPIQKQVEIATIILLNAPY